jgi:hypothetical protein
MRVAVIAAPNPGYLNPGMLTVDLAAAAVLTRAVPQAVLSWYTLHPPDQFGEIHPYLNPSELPFKWQSLVERFDDVCDHDVILLWGDFLQARHYFVEDACERLVLGSNGRMSTAEAMAVLHRTLLFSDAPMSVLNKVIIFGSTILFNRQTDYAREPYGEHLLRLIGHCRGIWVREPISAAKIQHLRHDYASIPVGTDSAFLLRDEDLAGLSTTSWIADPPFANHIGVFLGTRTRPPLALVRFLTQVAQQLGLQLEWLPWFPVHEWLRAVPVSLKRPVRSALLLHSQHKIERLLIRGPRYSAGDLFTAIARYRFIVTDTYHLCVNAWRAGTPALCFGSVDPPPAQQSLSDYKKRILYEMYDATDFYFSTSSVESAVSRKRAFARVLQITSDDAIARAITERIRAHAQSVESALAERLADPNPT